MVTYLFIFSGGLADPYFFHFFHFSHFSGIWVVTYLFIFLPWPGGLLIYLFIHCGLVECSFIHFLLSLILAGSSFIYSEPAPLHLGITGFHQIEGNHLFIYFSS